jgi:hypothetical protein
MVADVVTFLTTHWLGEELLILLQRVGEHGRLVGDVPDF